jgi:hypothetical protein
MKTMRCRLALFFFAWGAAALASCAGRWGGSYVPVRGKVTLGDRPLVGGTVTFVLLDGDAKAPRPEGDIDSQGLYSLKTAGKEGAPPGKYRAILTTSGEDKRQDTLFDPRYSHEERSPLEIEVREDAPAGQYDLKLQPLRRR